VPAATVLACFHDGNGRDREVNVAATRPSCTQRSASIASLAGSAEPGRLPPRHQRDQSVAVVCNWPSGRADPRQYAAWGDRPLLFRPRADHFDAGAQVNKLWNAAGILVFPASRTVSWQTPARLARLLPFQEATLREAMMLWTIVIILLVLWLLGFMSGTVGGLIHILLVIAIIVVLIRVIQGRRPV
jgi:hypothetical protein